jgi:isoquinoline 1-oxidoreductase beta subunit
LRIDPDGTVTVMVAKSEMGQGVITALPMILAEELEADWTKVRFERADADERYGDMGTGGSTSVRTSWEPLRMAGAAAREMLLTAAAGIWAVDRSACRAEQGAVVHIADGKRLTYGELAPAASGLEVPADIPLKEPKDFHLIGSRTPRLDTPEKVDGTAMFGLDVRVPGMLYAVVARCPVFGGKVKSFDAEKARSVPGVKHVVEIGSGIAVAADNTWNAIQGRNALDILWDEGENALLDSDGIHAMLEESSAKPGAVAEEKGDPAILDGASGKIEAVYELPYLAHAPMEPINCTADVKPESCEIWIPTQSAQWARGVAAAILELKQESVTAHVSYVGGGFGRRFDPDVAIEAVAVSKAVNAPVKVVWTREDDMHHDWYRPTSLHKLSGAVDGQGGLLALSHRVTAPSITGQRWPDQVKNGLDEGAVEGASKLEYDIPNNRLEYVMANTAVPVGWWRSVYPTQNVFAVESFVDELAHKAGADPFEFRRRSMKKGSRLKKVLELAAEKSGWGARLPDGWGRGIACAPPAFFGSYIAHVAEVSVDDRDIRVHRVVCAVDCGIVINPDTIEAQMESSIAFALTAALRGEITIGRGRVVESNFDDYPILTFDEMPKVEVYIVPSTEPVGGIGEPGVPPLPPAVTNAIFAASGRRIRKLPIRL